MRRSEEECCRKCKYWVSAESGHEPQKTALCKRYPPTYATGWPTTYDGAWCGEFREKNPFVPPLPSEPPRNEFLKEGKSERTPVENKQSK